MSQQGKYKILTREAYELLSDSKPPLKKEDSVVNQFSTGYNTATQREGCEKFPPIPQSPTPLRKCFHDYSDISDVKPKVRFNLGSKTLDLAGNTPL